MKLDSFTSAYIEAALWASMDDDCNPLDANYGISDLSECALAKITADCERFQAENIIPDYDNREYTDAEMAGHDFFLTRNHHGAGFWDRDALSEEDRDRLTAAAHSFGGCDLYVGDDGKIYVS